MQQGLLRESQQQQAAVACGGEPPTDEARMTLAELEQKKYAARKEAFGVQTKEGRKERTILVKEEGGGYIRKTFSDVHGMKQVRPTKSAIGNDDVQLPLGCNKLVDALRDTELFKACVARERETPLTPLHLMQPVSFLLWIAAIVSTVFASLRLAGFVHQERGTFERQIAAISHVAGLGLASAALLYVGLKARDCPTQEQLHVQLAKEIDELGVSADTSEENADQAEKLAGVTLRWIEERKQQKVETRNLQERYKSNEIQRQEFELKQHLCRYLMRGELELAKRQAAKLERQLLKEEIPLAEYREKKKGCEVDGRMSAHELERVVTQIGVTESKHTLYGILGKVLKELYEHSAAAEEDGAEGGGGAKEVTSWSYRGIFQHVHECVHSHRYKADFDQFLKIDAAKGGTRKEGSSSAAAVPAEGASTPAAASVAEGATPPQGADAAGSSSSPAASPAASPVGGSCLRGGGKASVEAQVAQVDALPSPSGGGGCSRETGGSSAGDASPSASSSSPSARSRQSSRFSLFGKRKSAAVDPTDGRVIN